MKDESAPHKNDPLLDKSDERRQYKRFEVTAYVDYTGTEVLLYHRIENISIGGICIQTNMLESLGTLVDLIINFPEQDESISVVGEVVWANPNEPMDMGLRFTNLDDEQLTIIRRYLEAQKKKQQ